MAKLSAFIIAKNEASRISKTILSLKDIAEEIIVVDSGSTDDTVEISRNLGAKVVFNEWKGYVAQKTFGEKLCANDWIINLDADEELSEPLRKEIRYIFESDIQDRYHAYSIRLVIVRRSEDNPRKFAPYNDCIRIYDRKYCGFGKVENFTTKDSVEFNDYVDRKEKTYALNNIAYHRSGSSIGQLVAKANFYSGEQADDLVKENRDISNFMVALSLILSYAAPRPFNIGSLLFGELLWVGTGDVIILSLIALACFLFFFLFYRQIILISLNEDMAKVSGAKTERIELFFLFLLSLSVFSAVKIVGALLVASISIVPASCAKFFSKSPGGMILNSVFISLAVNCAGLFFSFRFDLPVSASILVTGSILYFLLVFFFSLGSRKKV